MTTVFLLLLIYQIKHWLADYPLQGWPFTKFMLRKFLPDWGFFWPLAAHAAVHGALTLVICLIFAPSLWGLCLFDACMHFSMDRVKAHPQLLGRFKPLTIPLDQAPTSSPYGRKMIRSNAFFWWSLGFDQAVHHLTHYCIIYAIVTRST